MPSLRQPRGTRAALDAKASGSTIVPGQVYVVTDEERLAFGLTSSTYATAGGIAKMFEPSGAHIDQSTTANAPTTLAAVENRVYLSPFFVTDAIEIDRIGVSLSATDPAARIRLGIYSSDSRGRPDSLAFSSADMNASATGYLFESLTFTFKASSIFWLAFHSVFTPTPRSIPVNGQRSLGLGTGVNGTAYMTCIHRTVTYASGLPSAWGHLNSELVSAVMPSIRMRVA